MVAVSLELCSELVLFYFIGHLNDPELLAGIGMGTIMVNIFTYSSIYGLN